MRPPVVNTNNWITPGVGNRVAGSIHLCKEKTPLDSAAIPVLDSPERSCHKLTNRAEPFAGSQFACERFTCSFYQPCPGDSFLNETDYGLIETPV